MPRIVSLIASATEIACALGFEDQLVGRSHECDYPESVKRLPACTEPKFPVTGSSYEIDQRVRLHQPRLERLHQALAAGNEERLLVAVADRRQGLLDGVRAAIVVDD